MPITRPPFRFRFRPACRPAAARLRSRADRGIVLMLAMVTLVVLVLLVYSFVRTISIGAIISDNNSQTITTTWAARGGLTLGATHLELDEEPAFDSLNEPWAQEVENREIGNTTLKIRVTDEARKFNILSLVRAEEQAEKEWAEKVLVRLIEVARNEDNETLESHEAEANELVRRIREWLEDTDASGDQDATLGENPSAAVGNADNLEDANEVEINKTSPFEILTIAELMQVKGVTRELLYGPDETELEQRKEYDEFGEPIEDYETYEEDEEPTRVALLDFVTASSGSELQVNINTAPKEVLVAIMMADGVNPSTAESIADSIISAREQPPEEEQQQEENPPAEGEEEEDDYSFRQADIAANAFQSFQEKIDNQELTQEMYDKLRTHLTVRSNYFSVAATAVELREGADETLREGRIRQTWRGLYRRVRDGGEYKMILLVLDKED